MKILKIKKVECLIVETDKRKFRCIENNWEAFYLGSGWESCLDSIIKEIENSIKKYHENLD